MSLKTTALLITLGAQTHKENFHIFLVALIAGNFQKAALCLRYLMRPNASHYIRPADRENIERKIQALSAKNDMLVIPDEKGLALRFAAIECSIFLDMIAAGRIQEYIS